MNKLLFSLFLLLFSYEYVCATSNFVWSEKAARMPVGCGGASAVSVNNKIYVIGGINWLNGKMNDLQVYDLATDSWTIKMPMPTARSDFAIGLVNNKIYVIGGDKGSGISNTVEVYNIATDSWTTKANMLTPRRHLFGAVVNNKIYAIGGDSGVTTNIVEEYDTATDSWVSKSSMNDARIYFQTAVFNEKVYVFSGRERTSTEVYDTTLDTWTMKTDIPSSREFASAIVISSRIYVIGGYPYSDLIYEYDPATDKWYSKKNTIPSYNPIYRCAHLSINNRAYLIGGRYDNSNVMFEGKTTLFTDDSYLNGFSPTSSDSVPNDFTFKVRFISLDSQPPDTGYPKLHVQKGGNEISGSPFTMNYLSGTYNAGAVYEYGVTLDKVGSDYTYFYEVSPGVNETTLNGPVITTSQMVNRFINTTIESGCDSGKLTITLPAGTFADDVTLSISFAAVENALTADINTDIKLSPTGFSIDNDKNLQPTKEISISINYQNGYLSNLNEKYLVLGRFDPVSGRWLILPSKVDTVSKTIVAKTNHLSTFALMSVSNNPPNDLGKAYCYPTPVVFSKGEYIKFANITPLSKINIISTAGHTIKTLEADSNGVVPQWDGITDSGEKCASGIYVVHVKDNKGNRRVFEIVIIR